MKLNRTNIEKVAKDAEADAGHAVPGLREALAEAKAGTFAAAHTPEQIAARKRRCPAKVNAVLREAMQGGKLVT